MTPVLGVSQAPWSLIVYRDLTHVRTLNLQAMTMVATLLLAILSAPFLAVVIWCAIRRPGFAPEWLWPNRARMSTYVYLIAAFSFLIILFLFLGFTGPTEQNLIACAAIPYAAFLLTMWCIRAYTPRRQKGLTLGNKQFLLRACKHRHVDRGGFPAGGNLAAALFVCLYLFRFLPDHRGAASARSTATSSCPLVKAHLSTHRRRLPFLAP